VQVVGYRTAVREDGPALVVAEDGVVSRVSLAPGERLDYGLGERHCAGAVAGDTHHACSDGSAPYCPVHSSTWVCARCTGDCLKEEMDCHEDHAIYLAAFAPATFKVGVTREWRLDTRLREQGAQRAAHLRTVANGRLAREIESDIATEIPDRVRVPAKLDGLHETVDADAWDALLADFDPIEEFAFDYGFDLATRPVATTAARGTVVGTQGRVLVLERDGTTYGVDLRDLVGHELDPELESAARQASLTSYR